MSRKRRRATAGAPPRSPATPSSPAAPEAPPPARGLRRHALAALAVLVCVGVHVTAVRNPFVYDDLVTVVSNPTLEPPLNVFAVVLFQRFRPMVNLSYALDVVVWGLDPVGFHLTNLLLHSVNVVLLYVLALGLCQARPDDPRARRAPVLAALVAVLFAIHPMSTSAADYVTARSELLALMFVLCGCLAFRRALRAGASRAWLLLPVLCFVLAAASKETGAMLPLVLLGYEWLLARGAPGRRLRLLALHGPVLLVALSGGVVRLLFYQRVEGGSGLVTSPMEAAGTYAATQLVVFWRYLALLVVPVGQSIVHQVHDVTALTWSVAFSAAGLVMVLVFAVRERARDPVLVFGVLWFLLLLAPTALTPLTENMAEHRVYAAGAGFFLVVGALVARLADTASPRALAAVGVAAVLALSAASLARIRVWRDPVTLWSDAARKAPDVAAPFYALGDALRVRGDCAAAIRAYERAVEILPSYLDANNNLGICAAQLGDLERARQAFQAALAVHPGHIPALNNLGRLERLSGHHELARRYLTRSLELDGSNAKARAELAQLPPP